MLLRIWKEKDWRKMIAVGQFSMIIGFVFLLLALAIYRGATVPPMLVRVVGADFWRGLSVGLGIAAMLLSVVMNVRGLVYYRRNKTK